MLTREEVLRIARLARLELTEEEIESMRVELSRILEYVKEINLAGADDFDPTFQTFEKPTPLREDVPEKRFEAEEILRNAPLRKDKFFSVPKIIE